eukprot:1170953-Pyramimonas_sp.AAC.1
MSCPSILYCHSIVVPVKDIESFSHRVDLPTRAVHELVPGLFRRLSESENSSVHGVLEASERCELVLS